MRNGNNYQDKELKCVECGGQFTFSAGEQDYYAQRSFSQPKRCPNCRAERKQRQAREQLDGAGR
jgi:ssDNA-binding Zn-finger/Zn-ribbon topoisomerase 1